jgi:hypothetical protein
MICALFLEVVRFNELTSRAEALALMGLGSVALVGEVQEALMAKAR